MGGSLITVLMAISILLLLLAACLAFRLLLVNRSSGWLLLGGALLVVSPLAMLLSAELDDQFRALALLALSAVLSGGMLHTYRLIRQIEEKGQALAESEKMYRTLVETMNESVVTVDREGRISYANSKAVELLGAGKGDIVGTPISRYCAERCSREFLLGVRRPEKSPLSLETRIVDAGGRIREVLVSISPLINERGEVTGSIATMSDITRLKRTEEKLRDYAKKLKRSNELKDLFIDILHHDLLNYASIIRGHAEVALNTGMDREEVGIVKRNVERIIEVIESATKFSKLADMRRVSVVRLDLAEVIGDVLEELQPVFREAGMRVESSISRGMEVVANPIVREIFWNFLSNAAKYAREGKRVKVYAEEMRNCWVVKVADFGPGVPEEQKGRIFNRFSRMSKEGVKGSGLGLAIAKRIAELHGGRVGVEDNPGGGSIFWVELPKGCG
ncbi:MAG: PAS domain S-box protein [Euryarchaeota archaeon]|nr:PAS domain S-box protein [Euryarchaeota archaeon]